MYNELAAERGVVMKIIFDSEEEKKDFCEAYCPDIIGLENNCMRSTEECICEECWEKAIECEVAE